MKHSISPEVLGHPIAFYPIFIDLLGSKQSAIMLSQMFYWQQRCPAGRDGWWWKTQEDWFNEVRLTRADQEKARKKMLDLGFLEESKKGIPCRLWFRLDIGELNHAVQDTVSRQTNKPIKHVRRDSAGRFAKLSELKAANKRHSISETSSKNTAKTSPQPACGGKRLKKYVKSDIHSYEAMMGVQIPIEIKKLTDIERVVAIIIQARLVPEDIRFLFAEFVNCCQRQTVHDPWALFVSLSNKSKAGELKLSVGGEKNLPCWV